MRFVALRSFRLPTWTHNYVKVVDAPKGCDPSHVPAGTMLDIGDAKTLKELELELSGPDRTTALRCYVDLRSSFAIGDPSDPKTMAKVDEHRAWEKRNAAQIARSRAIMDAADKRALAAVGA